MLTNTVPAHLHSVLADVHKRLASHYGMRLRQLVLFGSQARGEAHAGSDLDLLVILDAPVHQLPEIKALSFLAYELTESHGISLQLLPFSEADYWNLDNPLMQNAHREGIVL